MVKFTRQFFVNVWISLILFRYLHIFADICYKYAIKSRIRHFYKKIVTEYLKNSKIKKEK